MPMKTVLTAAARRHPVPWRNGNGPTMLPTMGSSACVGGCDECCSFDVVPPSRKFQQAGSACSFVRQKIPYIDREPFPSLDGRRDADVDTDRRHFGLILFPLPASLGGCNWLHEAATADQLPAKAFRGGHGSRAPSSSSGRVAYLHILLAAVVRPTLSSWAD